MKKILSFVSALLFVAVAMSAQNSSGTFERVYVSTDASAYLAGDRIWCSAFCFDVESRQLSEFSAIAYVQLVSSRGLEASCKIALDFGRGSGYIDLPVSIPTGRYSLFAFTAQNKNEKDYDYLQNALKIDVYNTSTPDKISVVMDEEYVARWDAEKYAGESSQISVHHSSSIPSGSALKMEVSSEKGASLSVAVSRRDDLDGRAAANRGISSFTMPDAGSLVYEPIVLPEYDGEILYGRIDGADAYRFYESETTLTGYVSTVGSVNDTYTALPFGNDMLAVRTSNIYGVKDIVTQVDGMDDDVDAHITLMTPFVLPENYVQDTLYIGSAIKDVLMERSEALTKFRRDRQEEISFYSRMRMQPALLASDMKEYDLDDYTRFPTMREVLVEIVPELRSRGRGEKARIELLIPGDNQRGTNAIWSQSLVMIDGVPVFKHSKVMDYDAMLVSKVQIWRKRYFFGNRAYEGAINFVTRSGGIAYVDFGSNVRITDFNGASYPLGNNTGTGNFWMPVLTLSEGQSETILAKLPDEPGWYEVIVEGCTLDGKPVRTTSVVEVK